MKPAVSASDHRTPVRSGRLDWRPLLDWLREDGLISATDADSTARRFAGGHSKQHPLVRLAAADLIREGTV